MKKVLVVVLIMLAVAAFGCTPQRKPVPESPRVIPKESTLGYRQVDLDDAPLEIQRLASFMSEREMAAWAVADDNSYVLINYGQEDNGVKVNEIIQQVPRQDFLWVHVKLEYNEEENNNNQDLLVLRLEQTDKFIDGVGFEFTDGEEDGEEETAAENEGTTPAPAARAPATPAPAARKPLPRAQPDVEERAPAPTEQVRPQEPQNQIQPDEPENKTDNNNN
jgi:hypothetical protein